nr:neuroblastoma-amplified sequence-like [Halyomorpha halys]
MVILSEASICNHAIDIDWRRDNKLIVGWKNGTISIHDVNSSVVLTYFGCEILNGLPRLTSAPSLHGFLVLECETVHFVRPSVSPDMSSDDEKSIFDSTLDLMKSTMYLLTDLEKYEPKMKSIKIVQRIFRLLGVKMTTPEEVFERYLQTNEFQKAYEICDEYGLDIMKVYQRQWRTSEVNEETIQEFLNNVQDEEWILNECLERVAESLLGAKLLMEYSLQFTDRKSYIYEMKNLNEPKFKKFIISRCKFLDYAAKFQVYKQIFDESSYDMDHYEKFRKQNIVDSAVDFARSGNTTAVKLLFTYHGKEILPYRLNILDNFPESMNPLDYRCLLPECDGDGQPLSWKCYKDYETLDWSQKECSSELKESYTAPLKTFDDIYDFNAEGLSHWYKKRALALEKLSTVVDNAVKLLELGIEHNIKDLEETLYELKMLSILVYELNLDVNYSFLKKQCTLQKLQLFIQKPEEFYINMIKYVHPALEHYADKHSDHWFLLYRTFLMNNSKKTLGQVIKYISYILHLSLDLIGPHERIVDVLVDCIYAYESLDLLNESEKLIIEMEEWLLSLSENKIENRKQLSHSLLVLKNEIKCANILLIHKYGRPVSYLHELKNNFEESKQFIEGFANTVIKLLPTDINAWVAFLPDLLDLQEYCFYSIPVEFGYEIFVSHMLKSSSIELIENSADFLCCSKNAIPTILCYETSVRIIITSSQYYFNSSTHFDDKFMHLAKNCLLLIEEDYETIQEELDLIFAMKLLSELNINILPIQVRQTKERMKLIDICLDRNSRAYQKPQLIYRLAFKLHILHPDRKRCFYTITLRLAQEAYKRCDYNACAEFCDELIKRKFSDSWKICMNLGECDEYKDIKNKLRLITFSSIYAPARVLPHLFKIREELKCNQMILKLHGLLDSSIEFDICKKTRPFHKWSRLKDLIFVDYKEDKLQVITQICYDVISDKDNLRMDSADFRMVFPDFYLLLHPQTYRIQDHDWILSSTVSKESIMFGIFELFLKLFIIYSDLKDYRIKEIVKTALTSSSILVSKGDSALFMCYSLCLEAFPEKFEINNFFKESHLLFVYKLYFIALKDSIEHLKNIFSSNPAEVITRFIDKPYNELNLKSLNLLIKCFKNYNQAKQVNSIECGIDTARFNRDEQYMKDTIFGLAMNEDYDKLKLAADLARQNNIPVHEVVVSHLISLVIHSSLTLITERISNEEIASIIDGSKEFCVESLLTILETINGTNYQTLISFFSLMKILKDDCCIWSLTPKEHISLLKKLKSLTKDVSYKDLLLSNDELHFILQPLMNNENFLVVCKFIKSLPAVIKSKYQIEKFFGQWAIEEFNKKCINVSFKQSVLNFENLGKFFAKLSEEELKNFFESTISSLSTVSVMDSGLRKQLLISLIDWCYSNNLRNQYESLLIFLQKEVDILNQLWDEDYENWNLHLKNYVFLLEQNLRESNSEESINQVIKSALLDPAISNSDIIYLHKIAQIKEPVFSMAVNLLNSSNPEVLDKWKKLFSHSGEKLENINYSNFYENISETDKDLPCALEEDWKEKLFSAFEEQFPHQVLRDHLNNVQSCLSFIPELILKISNFNQTFILHKYLQRLVGSMEYDKTCFGTALLKSLSNVESPCKYALAEDIISSNSIPIKDIYDMINSDETFSDKLFVSWLCFYYDSSDIHSIGRSLIDNEDDQIEDKLLSLPPIVIAKMVPFILGTDVFQRLIMKYYDKVPDEIVKCCVRALEEKCMAFEASTLSLRFNQTPKGLVSFATACSYSSFSS